MPRELEMRDVWCGDRPNELEPVQVVSDTSKQALAAAQECRHHSDLDLVHEAGRQVLRRRPGAAREGYIPPSGGSSRLIERCLDALGDERERGPTLEREWRASVLREHEHRMVERWVDSPPPVPRFRWIPGTGVAAEHVPPHHGGSDVGKRLLDDLAALVYLSALEAVHRSPDC